MKVDPKQIKGRWPNILVGVVVTVVSYLLGALFPPAVDVVGDNADATVSALPSAATTTASDVGK